MEGDAQTDQDVYEDKCSRRGAVHQPHHTGGKRGSDPVAMCARVQTGPSDVTMLSRRMTWVNSEE